MRKYLAAVVSAVALGLANVAPAAIFYEGFDYAPGNLGLNTNPSVTQQWYSSATSGTDDRVQVSGGSLTAPSGLPASTGNMSTFGGPGRTDRIFLGQNRNSGSVYFSMLMKITDLTGTAAGGATVFGFNNTAQTLSNHDTAAQPATISGRLIIRPLAANPTNQYEIGIHKSAGTTGQFVFYATPFTLTDTVYLVARYTYNTGTSSDDVMDLWVNPPGSTFGDDNLTPAPDITETAGTDTGQIATIILRQTTAIVPTGMQVDEIRVDTTWAHATSDLIPEPSSLGLFAASATLLSRRRARQRKIDRR